MNGQIHCYTGDGKGKTTAALGLVVRAVGAGKKVVWVAFDKGGDHYAEREVLAKRFPEVELFVTGLDRMNQKTETDPQSVDSPSASPPVRSTSESVGFRFGVTEEDKAEGERGLGIVRDLFAKAEHDLIILDEINISTHLGIVKEADVLALLSSKPKNLELVLTGRAAPTSFIELSDLVTEMRMNKHYIQKGVKARPGFDY